MAFCTACGDGICRGEENSCNRPRDCPADAGSDAGDPDAADAVTDLDAADRDAAETVAAD